MRVMASVCGISSFLGGCFHIFSPAPQTSLYICYGLATFAFFAIYLKHGDKKSLFMWAMYALHNLSLIVGLYFLTETLTEFGFLLSSTLFLGAVTFAMVKGHWYLVTPKLSELPLAKAVIFTWILLTIKVVITTIGYIQARDFFSSMTTMGGGYAFNWMMLLMRIVWGYVIILIMSYYGWRLVRMRSIQSATGIFYAMVIFVFIGELISSYLFFKHGLYI